MLMTAESAFQEVMLIHHNISARYGGLQAVGKVFLVFQLLDRTGRGFLGISGNYGAGVFPQYFPDARTNWAHQGGSPKLCPPYFLELPVPPQADTSPLS